mmetsp:Transcript_11165/g.14034  ORF Transcript_11165/g.14034 Transcript_11165/m.14034 type:complete len:170 (-) Transcript_11165:50-559(-)
MMWRKLILHCLISISILSIQTLHTSASKHQKHHVNKTNTDTKFDSAKLYDDKPTMEDIELYLKSIGIKNNDFCEYQRRIQQGEQQQQREEEEKEEGGYLPNAVMAFMCVSVAALAAGLTMGLMSQEVLDLRIKELAASNISERKQAKSLIPLVSDRHRLKSLYLLIRAK